MNTTIDLSRIIGELQITGIRIPNAGIGEFETEIDETTDLEVLEESASLQPIKTIAISKS